MTNSNNYSFGFTAASLQVPTMASLAQRIIADQISATELHPDHMEKERFKTAKRELTELKRRLATLSIDELELLSSGYYEQQQQLSLVAFSRAYQFFYDFIMEVVVEKLSVFDYTLSDMDYNVFFNQKAIDHPEIEALTPLTQSKIKQVVFKVLEQAGLINSIKERHINIPILSTAILDVVKATNPRDLLILLQKR